MRKFYYLDSKKEWKGPYFRFSILWMALRCKLGPYSYLWHDRVGPGPSISNHPVNSVYPRLYAHRIIPKWLFGYNLNIQYKNIIGSIKRKFRKDPLQKLIEVPQDTPFLIEKAFQSYLIPSIVAIHDSIGVVNYDLKLAYIDRAGEPEPVISTFPIKVFRDGKRGFRFEILMPEPPSVSGVYHHESYGLNRELILSSENEILQVQPNSVYGFSTRVPYRPQILNGRFRQLNIWKEHLYQNNYNRVILEIEDDFPVSPGQVIEHHGLLMFDHDPFNVHQSSMGVKFRHPRPHILVTIGNKSYSFYAPDDKLLVLEGRIEEDLLEFKQKSETIRLAFALLCGRFYGGECRYVTSSDQNFRQINGVWFEQERESVISDRRPIDLHLFRAQRVEMDGMAEGNNAEAEKLMPISVFNALCTLLWEDVEIRKAASSVVTAMANPDPIQQGSFYAVALETLTNVLSTEKAADLKPIKDKTLSSRIIGELKNVINNNKAELTGDAFRVLGIKLDNINSPANQDKLTKTFGVMGIVLDQTDLDAIKNRNNYLHGRSPLPISQQFELTEISLRLHTLVVALLLKRAGYNGHVINLDINLSIRDEDRLGQIAGDFARGIQEIVGGLQVALENRDSKDINSWKEKLEGLTSSNKLSKLVRVI